MWLAALFQHLAPLFGRSALSSRPRGGYFVSHSCLGEAPVVVKQGRQLACCLSESEFYLVS